MPNSPITKLASPSSEPLAKLHAATSAGKTRVAAPTRAAKKEAARQLRDTFQQTSLKPESLFKSEVKAIKVVLKQAPRVLPVAAAGAGVAAAAFTHSMWLPQTLGFLHTTPGLITLGVVAAVGIGLVGFYLARKTKLNVAQFMGWHGGAADAASKQASNSPKAEPKAESPARRASPKVSSAAAASAGPSTSKSASKPASRRRATFASPSSRSSVGTPHRLSTPFYDVTNDFVPATSVSSSEA